MGALQLSLLPGINTGATRRRVEDVLDTVRVYRQLGAVRRESRYTPSYTPRYHGSTNGINKPTEDVAISNVMREEYLSDLSARLDKALGALDARERQIVEIRYLISGDVLDINVCADLHYNERTYRRIKGSAMYKLAFALRLEVFHK